MRRRVIENAYYAGGARFPPSTVTATSSGSDRSSTRSFQEVFGQQPATSSDSPVWFEGITTNMLVPESIGVVAQASNLDPLSSPG